MNSDLPTHPDDKDLPITSPILIYGAGKKGREVYRFLTSKGYVVESFIDSHATPRQTCEAIPVHSPATWRRSTSAKEYTVVVAIHNCSVNMAVLLSEIRTLGFARVINIIELYNLFPGQLPNHYWLTSRAYYQRFKTEIEHASRLFFDEASKRLFLDVVAFRTSADYEQLPAPSMTDQYRPRDLPRWPDPLRFIDCGAYTGDTLEDFARSGYSFESIAAFEPDRACFNQLVHITRKHKTATCFPCGVSDNTCLSCFKSDSGGASQLVEEGSRVVQCVALDDVLIGFSPTLIKMDIEGAELKALNGAKRIIEEDRPALAISLYHHPAHLWQIPLFLNSWSMEYSFHLRAHGYSTFDVILYAIP